MKKALFLFLTTFTIITSNAQIQVQESFSNDLVIIGNISTGKAANVMGAMNGRYTPPSPEHKLYCRIFRDKVTYGILVNTENRFDDDFEFALGTDTGKAKESINSIIELMATKPLKTSVTVKDEDERTIQINLQTRKLITLDVIDSKGAIICNKVYLTRANLDRALKLLDKKAEDKVKERIEQNKMK